jgi:hypothetical protein
MTTHLGSDGYFFDDETKEAKELPLHVQVVIRHGGCGHTQLIEVLCADPFCVECAKARTKRIRAMWLPVLESMHSPKMITLTSRSRPTLRQAVKEFQASFRRMLDLRLDKRGLPKLVKDTLDFVRNPPKELAEELGEESEAAREKRWTESVEKFRLDCVRKAKKVKLNRSGKNKWKPRKDQRVRMRDMIGFGFADCETTYNPDEGFHFHRHLAVDGAFIPWPLLVTAWTMATKGDGTVAHIQSVGKSMKAMDELIKYIVKPWEIPDDKKDEVREVVFGMKRIWPIGGAKPEKVVAICPFCGEDSCKAHRITGYVTTMDEGTHPDGTRYRQVWDGREEHSYLFTLEHGLWVGADDPPFVLIPKGIACHSQAPPGEKVRQETLDELMVDLFASVPAVV